MFICVRGQVEYKNNLFTYEEFLVIGRVIGTILRNRMSEETLTQEQRAIRQHLSKPAPMMNPCGCMGPQDDDPVCPCAMRYVEKVDGVWYRVEEHRSPDGVTHTATKLGA